jgi:uncharacterized protein
MRKLLLLLTAFVLTGLVGCVTINVYFPQAAAEKAADQFIGSVLNGKSDAAPAKSGNKDSQPPANGQPPSASVIDLLVPAAYAADRPDLRIHTPAIDAIHDRMRQRFQSTLKPLFDDGAIGFTEAGLVAMRDASKVPLAQRAQANAAIAAENRDRNALYREIANANGHPEWESDIRKTFARLWIQNAHAGWYYRTDGGSWKRK